MEESAFAIFSGDARESVTLSGLAASVWAICSGGAAGFAMEVYDRPKGYSHTVKAAASTWLSQGEPLQSGRYPLQRSGTLCSLIVSYSQAQLQYNISDT